MNDQMSNHHRTFSSSSTDDSNISAQDSVSINVASAVDANDAVDTAKNGEKSSKKKRTWRRLQCFLWLGLTLSIGGILVQVSKVSHQFKYHQSGSEKRRKTKKKHSKSPAMTVILNNINNGRSIDRKDDIGDSLVSSSSMTDMPTTRSNSREFQAHSLSTGTVQVVEKSDVKDNNNNSTFHRGRDGFTSSESWNANSTMITNTTTGKNNYKVVGRHKPRNPLVQRPGRRPLVWSNLSIHHVVDDIPKSLETQDLDENVLNPEDTGISLSS